MVAGTAADKPATAGCSGCPVLDTAPVDTVDTAAAAAAVAHNILVPAAGTAVLDRLAEVTGTAPVGLRKSFSLVPCQLHPLFAGLVAHSV
jgi:hypothetical protein